MNNCQHDISVTVQELKIQEWINEQQKTIMILLIQTDESSNPMEKIGSSGYYQETIKDSVLIICFNATTFI